MAKRKQTGPAKRAAGTRLKEPAPLRVALTGAAGWFGRILLPALVAEPGVERVVCLDVREPVFSDPKVSYFTLDLTNPTADRLMADVLALEKVNAVAHAAFLSAPSNDLGFLHELTVIGTMNVLNACAAMGVTRIAVQSTTRVYGARPDNPAYLIETAPLRGNPADPSIKERVEVEGLVAAYAKRHPEAAVSVLRPCAIVGPRSRDFSARYLKSPIVPTLMGHDPVMQFVHESDAVKAFVAALTTGAAGPFNIVGDGVLPLSSAIHLLGTVNWPVVESLARAAAKGLWLTRLSPFPPEQFDLLRYILIADGRRMRETLKYTPAFSSREALTGVRGDSGEARRDRA